MMSISFDTEIASMRGVVIEKKVRRQVRTDRRTAIQLYDFILHNISFSGLHSLFFFDIQLVSNPYNCVFVIL